MIAQLVQYLANKRTTGKLQFDSQQRQDIFSSLQLTQAPTEIVARVLSSGWVLKKTTKQIKLVDKRIHRIKCKSGCMKLNFQLKYCSISSVFQVAPKLCRRPTLLASSYFLYFTFIILDGLHVSTSFCIILFPTKLPDRYIIQDHNTLLIYHSENKLDRKCPNCIRMIKSRTNVWIFINKCSNWSIHILLINYTFNCLMSNDQNVV